MFVMTTILATPSLGCERQPAPDAIMPSHPPYLSDGPVYGTMLTERRLAVAEVVSSRRTAGNTVATEILRYQENDLVTIRGTTARVFGALVLIDCEINQVVIVGERFYSSEGDLIHSRRVNSSRPHNEYAAWDMFRPVCSGEEPARDFESIAEFVRLAESYSE